MAIIAQVIEATTAEAALLVEIREDIENIYKCRAALITYSNEIGQDSARAEL